MIAVDEFEETQTDRDVELVVWSMNRFPMGSPERERMREIWFYAVSDGAMREGFPPGTEHKAELWQKLLAECRGSVM